MRTCLSLKNNRKVMQMLKRIINLGAVYYAAISGVLLVLAWIFGESFSVLEPSKFLFIMLFSFVASTGTAIKESNLVGRTTAGVCHAVCYIGGFFFCIILPYGKGFTFAVISLTLFTAGYAVVCILRSVISKRAGKNKKLLVKGSAKDSSVSKNETKSKKPTNKKAKNEAEYKSLFSDNSK